MKVFNNIYSERGINKNTTECIINELLQYQNFVFTIAPEGTRKKTDDVRSGFYHIATKTGSSIQIAYIDFQDQNISIKELFDEAMVQTTSYEVVKKEVEIAMSKEKPYYPENCYLVSNNENPDIKIDNKCAIKVSLININRSLLLYVPPLIVLSIMMRQIYLLCC